MTSYDFNIETLVLVIKGTGTLKKQNNYSSATHITLLGFDTLVDECFMYYNELLSISLPESLISIGNNVFQSTKIKEVHLPKNVQYLSASQSFDQQYEIGNVTVDPENPYFRDVDGVLYYKNMKTLYFYPGNRPETTCIVPVGVEIIKVGAFTNNRNRKEIIIPSTVKIIEWGFGYCSLAIEKVTILQCPRLIKIDKNALFAGTSKGEEIIHYEYTKCIIKNTCKYQNRRPVSFTTFLISLLLSFK